MTVGTYHAVLDGIGLRLAREKSGARRWARQDLPDKRASRSEIDAQHGQLDSEIRLPRAFRSGHAGYGHRDAVVPDGYHYAVNLDASIPGVVIRSPALGAIALPAGVGTPRGFFEVGGTLYGAFGRYLVAFAADDVATLHADAGVACAIGAAVWRDVAYVGLGASGHLRVTTAGTVTTVAALPAVAFGLAENVVGEVIVRATPSATVSYLSDPIADPTIASNWGSGIAVGAPGATITALLGIAGRLFVGKEDGLYTVDEAGRGRNLMPDLRGLTDGRNGQGMVAHGPSFLFPHLRGLFFVTGDGGDAIPIQPGYQTQNESPARGQVTALAADGPWIYATAVNGNGDSTLFKGRQRRGDEPGAGYFVWHPIRDLPGLVCEAIHLSTRGTNPRLYLGCVRGGTLPEVYALTLPRGADASPLDDPNCAVDREGWYYPGATDFGSPATTKSLAYADLLGENVSPADAFDVEVRADGGEWFGVGRVETSGPQRLAAPRTIAGEKLEARVRSIATVDAAAPDAARLRGVVLQAVERPPVVAVVTLTAVVASGLQRTDGAIEDRRVRTLLDRIRRLGQTRAPTSLVDPLGYSLRGYVLPAKEWVEVADEQVRDPELLLTVRFAVLEEAGLAFRYGVSTWGGGDVYSRRAAAEAFVYGASQWGGGDVYGGET